MYSTNVPNGKSFSVTHALHSRKVGYKLLRHNHIRGTVARLLDEICHDFQIEPHLCLSKAGPSRVMQSLLIMQDLTSKPHVYGNTPLSEHSEISRSSTRWETLVTKTYQILTKIKKRNTNNT